jgi:hypothetical protein
MNPGAGRHSPHHAWKEILRTLACEVGNRCGASTTSAASVWRNFKDCDIPSSWTLRTARRS